VFRRGLALENKCFPQNETDMTNPRICRVKVRLALENKCFLIVGTGSLDDS
jgi:hypothetical protein